MIVWIMLEHGGIMPQRTHWNSTTVDIFSPCDFFVGANQTFTLWTGVHMKMSPGTVGIITNKTKNAKRGIITSGTFDDKFTGQICIPLTNASRKKVFFEKGAKVAEILFVDAELPEMVLAEVKDGRQERRNIFGVGDSATGVS